VPSRTFRLATIRDIDIAVAPSWLLVAVVIVWAYQRSFGDRGTGVAIAMSVAVAVLFTLSVLLHELAHALEARHRGIEVGGITLFLLGGATALRDPDRRAADEFAIAGVGPWSNIVLAAVFGLLAVYTDSWDLEPAAEVFGLLGWLNLGLAAFNLIPGSPLDGGRVLRAGVWAVTGSRHRSTVVAAWFGIALGAGLVLWALWLVGIRSAVWAGLWVGVIGAYVLRAARGELARGRLALWLTGFTAAQLAPPTEDAPDPDGEDTADLPVVAADASGDRLVGLLDRAQPLVVIRGDDEAWTSSLHAIDARIRSLRDGDVPDEVVPS
jgi:Zn-dependent protease